VPTAFATISKRTLRRAIAGRSYRTRATTGSGSTTSAVIAALSGIGSDYVLDMPWGLCNDGNNAGEFRRATGLSATTVSFANAYTNTVASGVSMEFYPYPPNLYSEAIDQAIRKLNAQNGKVYRLVNSHIIPHSERKLNSSGYYSLPRNMVRVFEISMMGRRRLRDLFDRADSTTEPGNSWVETSGNLGISNEQLYQPSLSNGAHITRDLNMKDGVIEATLRGILNSGSTYCSPALTFRIAEDRNGDIDTDDYLVVRLLNAVVDLRKLTDGASESSLTTAAQTTADSTDYVVRVQLRGANIRIWVDDVELINYDLLGLNLKYTENPRVGIRWDVGGSPSNVARVRSYYAFGAEALGIWPDWSQDGDNTALVIPRNGNAAPTGLLYLQGRAPLTTLTADGVDSIDSDTTAKVEITTTDQAYECLLEQARAELFRLLGSEIYPTGIPHNSQQYLQLAQQHERQAQQMIGMTRPKAQMRGALTW